MKSQEMTTSCTTRTLILRFGFILSMLISAAVFGVMAYKISRGLEYNTAIQTYESIAASALEEAQAITKRKQQGGDALATAWSFAFPEASQWPFVGLRGYSQLATKVAALSASVGHGLMTIVRPDQAAEFEAHAKQIYMDFGYPELAGYRDFGFGIYGTGGDEYADGCFHDVSGNTTWDNKNKIMVPFLQHKNAYSNPTLLLRNMYQFELRGSVLDSIIDCGKAADPSMKESPKCSGVTDFTEIFVRPGPSAVFLHAIFPVDDPTFVVGFIGTSINWAETLTNVVPDYVDGLDCVISNGVESYTYVIHEGVPELLGEGDLHDPAFEEYGHSITLNDEDTDAKATNTFTLTVYPTEVMFDEFRTGIPWITSIGFVSAIVFCTSIFLLYDYFMKYESHQHKKILDVKRRFVRYISHEIRTPLNVVCMGLDLLRSELREQQQKERLHCLTMDSSSEQTQPINNFDEMSNKIEETDYWLQLLEEVNENSYNAVSILSDLLNYDKVESGTFELDLGRVNIWASVMKTVKEFAIQARNRKVNLHLDMKSIDGQALDSCDVEELSLDCRTSDLYVLGDEKRLSQVFRNLLSNALKFTPEYRDITITVSQIPNGLASVHLPKENSKDNSDAGLADASSHSPKQRAGSIQIKVTDNGVGLSNEQLGLLFNEGVQFNPNVLQHGGGSGLGLCITKEIVRMHSGTLEARSDGLGCGTTLVIELPLFRSSSTAAQATGTVISGSSLLSTEDSHYILVVDDILTNSKMLVRVLERNGHKCEVAVNGKEAIEVFKANQAALKSGETRLQLDTILMDFEMPIMNGPEATKHLRQLGCKADIFGVTGNVLAEDVATFKASGADTVLFKPINLQAIETAWQKHG